jgi:F-type H+-transporting ATPase subunit delta
MSQRTVARRYARALYEEADRLDAVDPIDEDVSLLRETLDASDELDRFFRSPVISVSKKIGVVQSLFDERTHELTTTFLVLLIRKDRENLVSSVVDEYQALRDEQRGIVEATVRTAHVLDETETAALEEALEQTTGKRIRLNIEQDVDLIGGVVVRIGDRVFDGSVRNKLDTLRERFRTSRVVADGPSENGT